MGVPPGTSPLQRPAPRILVLALLAAALLTTGLTPLRGATPARASTATTMAGQILSKINAARQGHGLGAVRVDSRLTGLASQRATTLAGLGVLSHDAAGCLTCQLAGLGVSYSFMGEVLASNSYPWGSGSASVIFSSWQGSPEHWDILMTARVDSIGIAVAESPSGSTYASAVLIDAPGVTSVAPSKPRTVVVAPTPAPPPKEPIVEAPVMPVQLEGSLLHGRIPC